MKLTKMATFSSRNPRKRYASGSLTRSILGILVLSILLVIQGAQSMEFSSSRIQTRRFPETFILSTEDFFEVLSSVVELRGGASYDDYDEEYDEYDVEEEEKDPPRRSSPRRQGPPSQNRPYDHRMARPPPRRPRKKQAHWAQRAAQQSIKKSGQLAWNAVIKQPGKLAYHLVRPKHVDLRELGGLWRIDQQVTINPRNPDKTIGSVATVSLDPRRRLVSVTAAAPEDGKGESRTVRQPFTFKKSRLGSYKTTFIAPAFLVSDQPRWYGYKGTWQRKLADAKVVKLVGKIYAVRKVKFGKQKGEWQMIGKPVGTFVARRRVQMMPEEEDEDEYDDEYDDEDSEDLEIGDDGEYDEDYDLEDL